MRNLLLALLSLGSLAGCASSVPPGEAYVKVKLCGSVKDENRYKVFTSGRVWMGLCSDVYSVPTREVRELFSQEPEEGETGDTSITFSGIDGQALNVDAAVSYYVGPDTDTIVDMIRTYGADMETIITGRVRDTVRDALNACASDSDMTAQDIYGKKKTILFECARKRVQSQFEPHGLHISSLTLGSQPRLPEAIRVAMEAAQTATQNADRARRELESTLAEGEKKKAQATAEAEALLTRATAEAEANRILSQSLTSSVLRSQELHIAEIKAQKWDGQLPTTLMGDDIPMIMDFGNDK
jgi:regulator of protease activity HflC (stomatin/prohibitin superfamily)